MVNAKFKFRDISYGLQKLRDFLLGRKHTLHGRFPPMVAPRTLPPANIPRGPDTKYSDKYYFQRNAFNSVYPPIVAPVAEGPPLKKDQVRKGTPSGAMRPDAICFNFAPTPGSAWWWDGHCYYECEPESSSPPTPSQEKDSLCPPDQKIIK
ncbi:unnamed protein product, partial [Brenthis ino]